MNIFANQTASAQKSKAEFLLEAQQRKARQFQVNVGLSWVTLLAIILFIFSGSHFLGIKTIQLDGNFIRANVGYIAGGIVQTLQISLISITFATILALLAALGRLSTFPPIYALSTFYVSLIRGTPLYLQIFFFFLALPQLGIVPSAFWSGVLPLSLNYGAYMSEIFRAGISSLGNGQREAAMALGMTPRQTMQRVILPQALRFAILTIG